MIRPRLGQLDFTMVSAITQVGVQLGQSQPCEACHIFNAWLVGRNDHQLLPRLCFAKATWPFDQAEQPDRTEEVSASILSLETADGEQQPAAGYAGQPTSDIPAKSASSGG